MKKRLSKHIIMEISTHMYFLPVYAVSHSLFGIFSTAVIGVIAEVLFHTMIFTVSMFPVKIIGLKFSEYSSICTVTLYPAIKTFPFNTFINSMLTI